MSDRHDETDSGETNQKTNDMTGTTSNLLDAGLLVFAASAISLGTSVLYVFGLSWAIRFPLQSYCGLQDYFQITPYWLGPVFGFALVFAQLHFFRILSTKASVVSKSPLTRIIFKCLSYCIPVVGIALIIFGGYWIIALALFVFATLRINGYASNKGLRENRHRPLWIHYSIRFGAPIGLFAFVFGALGTPLFFENEKTSDIYLSNAKGDEIRDPLRAKIIFSLSQFLVALRPNDICTIIPISRIERIETSINLPIRKWPLGTSGKAYASPNPHPATPSAVTQPPVPMSSLSPSASSAVRLPRREE